MKIGIIGCGGFGELRAQALQAVPEFQLTQVYDIDRQKAETFAKNYGGSAAKDWTALTGSSDVEAVIVSTPPSLHREICVEALQSGKHVLCEKPLARTPDECRQIVSAGNASGKFIATGFNYRFLPSIQKTRAILDSGLIGELQTIRSYAGYSAADHSQAWHHDAEVIGGGALWDNGIHLIDLTAYFLGEVSEIQGMTTYQTWNFPGSEDNGFGLLRGPSGKTAVLHASWTEWQGYKFKLELYGTLGCIRTTIFPMTTQVSSFSKIGEKVKTQKYYFPKIFVMEHLKSYRWVGVQSLILEFQAFHQAIQGQATNIATGMDGMRAVEIAAAIKNNF